MNDKKKKKYFCRHCGVELSWKEISGALLCVICESDARHKDLQFSELHGGAVRPKR